MTDINQTGTRGRATSTNPTNRFESIHMEPEEAPPESLNNQYFWDTTKNILSTNDSPDVGFDYSINPYRGCEHGCIYCYARPFHEYLGFSAGLDFESKIVVKRDAATLLRKALTRKSWQPQPIAMSGVTDPYQPIEQKFRITRSCLEVLAEFRNPVMMITKNALITRDIDLLAELASYNAVNIALSITTLDEDLRRRMEPRTSTADKRLDAIAQLRKAGIPAGVMVGPIIPGLNDEEVPDILKRVGEAGGLVANYTVARLPYAVKELFSDWLEANFPDRKSKVMSRIESLHNGKTVSTDFAQRMRGDGGIASQIAYSFKIGVEKSGIPQSKTKLSSESFRRPGMQRELFS